MLIEAVVAIDLLQSFPARKQIISQNVKAVPLSREKYGGYAS